MGCRPWSGVHISPLGRSLGRFQGLRRRPDMGSVYRPARHRVLQLLDGLEDPQPHHLAGCVVLSSKGVSPFHGLIGGTVPVLVYELLGAAVDVEVVHDLRLALGLFRGLT